MDSALILGLVFGILGIVLMIALVVGSIAFMIWFVKSWNKEKRRRQAHAEAQRQRHGGRTVLEWGGPRDQGAPDGEFGALLVELPKRGGGSARFYELGLVLDQKRVPYDALEDVFFNPGDEERGKDLKEAIQNSAVLWLYRKRGHTLAIRDFMYGFDHPTMENIQRGLGFTVDS